MKVNARSDPISFIPLASAVRAQQVRSLMKQGMKAVIVCRYMVCAISRMSHVPSLEHGGPLASLSCLFSRRTLITFGLLEAGMLQDISNHELDA